MDGQACQVSQGTAAAGQVLSRDVPAEQGLDPEQDTAEGGQAPYQHSAHPSDIHRATTGTYHTAAECDAEWERHVAGCHILDKWTMPNDDMRASLAWKASQGNIRLSTFFGTWVSAVEAYH